MGPPLKPDDHGVASLGWPQDKPSCFEFRNKIEQKFIEEVGMYIHFTEVPPLRKPKAEELKHKNPMN